MERGGNIPEFTPAEEQWFRQGEGKSAPESQEPAKPAGGERFSALEEVWFKEGEDRPEPTADDLPMLEKDQDYLRSTIPMYAEGSEERAALEHRLKTVTFAIEKLRRQQVEGAKPVDPMELVEDLTDEAEIIDDEKTVPDAKPLVIPPEDQPPSSASL